MRELRVAVPGGSAVARVTAVPWGSILAPELLPVVGMARSRLSSADPCSPGLRQLRLSLNSLTWGAGNHL